jgi:hypothetical protein
VLLAKEVAEVNEPITVDASSSVGVPEQTPVVVFQATLQLVTVSLSALVVIGLMPSVISDDVPV